MVIDRLRIRWTQVENIFSFLSCFENVFPSHRAFVQRTINLDRKSLKLRNCFYTRSKIKSRALRRLGSMQFKSRIFLRALIKMRKNVNDAIKLKLNLWNWKHFALINCAVFAGKLSDCAKPCERVKTRRSSADSLASQMQPL